MTSVSHKMAKGAAWMVAFKMIERSIGLVSTIILARLLDPSDFGLVAMATAFLGFIMLLTSFSFDVVLIQKQQVDRYLYDTAWTFGVIFGLLLALILAITAIPLAQFYNEARLEKIIYVLAISTVLGGFSNIGPVAFRKNLEFHKEFYFLLAKKLLSFTVCIALALSLRNYWALVWGTFAGRTLEVLLSYRVHPYRPRFCVRGRKELFDFSMWMFFNNTLFFIHNRMADFIVSKLLGSHYLGVYTVAYELSNLPTTELIAPINRAVLPGYARMVNDSVALRKGFLNVLSIIALCAIPAGVGIALVAEPLVLVVLGNNWCQAIPLVEILALSGMLMALQTNASVIYNALGKPKYMSGILFIHIVVFFLPMLFLFLQSDGLVGVSKAFLFSNLLIWPVNYYVSMRLLDIKIIEVLGVLWRPSFSAIIMYICTEILIKNIQYFYVIKSQFMILALYVIFGMAVYCFFVILFWILTGKLEGAERFIFKKLGLIKYEPRSL